MVQEPGDRGGLAVVDVGDDGDIADFQRLESFEELNSRPLAGDAPPVMAGTAPELAERTVSGTRPAAARGGKSGDWPGGRLI